MWTLVEVKTVGRVGLLDLYYLVNHRDVGDEGTPLTAFV